MWGGDAHPRAGVVRARGRERGWRLAAAESCTGGMIGALLTSVPGSSDVFVGGVVVYSNELKRNLLGGAEELLQAHGAVSAEVAAAMADGALVLGAECAIAVTGVAGPGGGSEAKPVGTVNLAVRTPRVRRTLSRRFPGDRAFVRELTANVALDQLRRAILEA